jgi:predicted transcriptional regulator
MTSPTTSLKLDVETGERVHKIAAVRRRTPHWIMREAIGEYLDREEQLEQLRQDALSVWDHYRKTGLHASAKEADTWLAKLEAGKTAKPPKCHR